MSNETRGFGRIVQININGIDKKQNEIKFSEKSLNKRKK